MMPLRFRPAAASELVSAEARYTAAYPGRGRRFLGAVEQTLTRISEAPEAFPLEHGTDSARSAKVLRFPYRIVFVVHEGTVFVIAVAHGRRRPSYWKRRRATP
jgi:toxin ParE1/3/4